MKWPARVIRDEQGDYLAICVTLPGCTGSGQTADEARQDLAESIRGYLAAVGDCCAGEMPQEVIEAS
jgi:predicted RNase H-like HicB family nuclease